MRGALTLLLFSAPFCGAATPIVLTDAEVARGLRQALVQGADRAVLQLGRENGFLANHACAFRSHRAWREPTPCCARSGWASTPISSSSR